jgi:hypothetical protein
MAINPKFFTQEPIEFGRAVEVWLVRHAPKYQRYLTRHVATSTGCVG